MKQICTTQVLLGDRHDTEQLHVSEVKEAVQSFEVLCYGYSNVVMIIRTHLYSEILHSYRVTVKAG